MGLGYWVIRTYEAGRIGEKIKYWVPGVRPTKSERRLRADIKKQEQNEASAVKRVARDIHANFIPNTDLLVTLDYSPDGYEKLLCSASDMEAEDIKAGRNTEMQSEYIRKAAEHEVRLFLRRVKSFCKPAGIELKSMTFTSDMDGETGEAVRIHHHIIVSAGSLDIMKAKWTLGGLHHVKLCDSSRFYNKDDMTELASYLLRQVRRLPDEKKYIPSRNLVHPKPQDRLAKNGAELKPPVKAELLHRNEFKPGRPQYIRYVLPVKDGSKAGRNKKESEAFASV